MKSFIEFVSEGAPPGVSHEMWRTIEKLHGRPDPGPESMSSTMRDTVANLHKKNAETPPSTKRPEHEHDKSTRNSYDPFSPYSPNSIYNHK